MSSSSSPTIDQSTPSQPECLSIDPKVPIPQKQNLQNTPTPSSSSQGFFQTPPEIPNQYHDDSALQRALTLFLPPQIQNALSPDLSRFSSLILSPKIFTWIHDAEHHPPYIKQFDTWGRRRDDLITSEGWRELQALGISEGIVAIPYENQHAEYSRVYQVAKLALWAGSAAWVNCPSLMVDGVATMFRRCLNRSGGEERKVLRDAYERLVSRDPSFAWTTGQWMTERQGGSDVSMTETLAVYAPEVDVEATATAEAKAKASDGNELGPWLINGFKWFSSATDADMVVMLARTSRGISTFFAPMRKTLARKDVLGNETELNGIRIQRLKSKLGTRALPTAELELKGVRGWLVGEEGRGTKEIATVLNVARIHNGVTAIGLWGRGLGVVRAFTRVRVVGRRPLWERTAFTQTLARMHTEYRANVLFNFFVAGLLGVDEQEEIALFKGQTPEKQPLGQVPGLRDTTMAKNLLRVLTPALKGHCSKTCISGLQECMECIGGVGYLENDDMQYNIARLYRDANVLPIWEGTTDMMADDSILRVLMGKMGVEVTESLEEWVNTILEQTRQTGMFEAQSTMVQEWWSELKKLLTRASRQEVELKSRAAMDSLVNVVQGSLLLFDAVRDKDEVACLIVEAWFAAKDSPRASMRQAMWEEQVRNNLKIVFGTDEMGSIKARL